MCVLSETVCRVVEPSRYTTMEFTVRRQSTPTRQSRHRPKSWSSPDPLLTSRTLRSTSSLQACIDEWADNARFEDASMDETNTRKAEEEPPTSWNKLGPMVVLQNKRRRKAGRNASSSFYQSCG